MTTEDQFCETLTKLNELSTLADQFHSAANVGGHDVRLELDGTVSYEINTACNCHPEYERRYLPREDFIKFISTNQ